MIEPETKDWTWVLRERCAECGTEASTLAPDDVARELSAAASRWADVLRRDGVADRPDDSTWSPLEYGAHSADVLEVMSTRLALIRSGDGPTFPDWDQDRAAVEGDYGSREPAEVARTFAERAEETGIVFGAVPEAAWERPGYRSDGAAFTVRTLAQYLLHDIRHHLHDVAG
ncbi:DinB family protein [Georgenia sp. Z1491]|uniref:DinB family protein n=1 Tax=Georgenia sp. Z1491 TaxID=3416707 RepID=UPI003CEBD2BD